MRCESPFRTLVDDVTVGEFPSGVPKSTNASSTLLAQAHPLLRLRVAVLRRLLHLLLRGYVVPLSEQDLEEAKALLAEAGHADGFNLTFTYPSENPAEA